MIHIIQTDRTYFCYLILYQIYIINKTFTCLSKSYGTNQSTIQFKWRKELQPHLWYRLLFNFTSVDNYHALFHQLALTNF